MATGLGMQLTGKVGEHLVTAELARRGILATPFSGNVPELDLLAYANTITHAIQVKTIDLNHGESWQFDIRRFLDVRKTAAGQKVLGKKKGLNRNLLCIFVALKGPLGKAEFYVLKYGWLQDFFAEHYRARRPPRKVDSFHCAIRRRDMNLHLAKWNLIELAFRIKANII